MFTILKCVCVLTLLKLVTCTNIAVILYPQHEDGNYPLFRSSDLRTNGIFTNFLRDFFNLLPNIPGRKLKRYCKMAVGEMKRFKYRQTKKLAKHIKYLSRTNRYLLQEEVATYKELLVDMPPARRDFLEAMDQVFTGQHAARFSNYIHDLRDYAGDYKLVIHDETRSILEMIVNAVKQMGIRDQIDIEKKYKKAVKEYEKADLWDLFGINPPPEPLVTLAPFV